MRQDLGGVHTLRISIPAREIALVSHCGLVADAMPTLIEVIDEEFGCLIRDGQIMAWSGDVSVSPPPEPPAISLIFFQMNVQS